MNYDILIHGTGLSTVMQINERDSRKPVVTISLTHSDADMLGTAVHCVAKDYIARYEVSSVEGRVEIPRRRNR